MKRLLLVFSGLAALAVAIAGTLIAWFALQGGEFRGSRTDFPIDAPQAAAIFKASIDSSVHGIRELRVYSDSTGIDSWHVIRFSCSPARFAAIVSAGHFRQQDALETTFNRPLPDWFDLPARLEKAGLREIDRSNQRNTVSFDTVIFQKQGNPTKMEYLAYDRSEHSAYYFTTNW